MQPFFLKVEGREQGILGPACLQTPWQLCQKNADIPLLLVTSTVTSDVTSSTYQFF